MSPTQLFESRFARSHWLAGLVLLLIAPCAGADWLVTLDDKLIETRGPWKIEGDRLTYVDVDGVEQNLDLDQVDLEGSEDTTELRGGKSEAPDDGASGEAAPATAEAGADEEEERGEPRVILYTGAMCRPCTQAWELLEELEVDFVIRDITKNRRPDASTVRRPATAADCRSSTSTGGSSTSSIPGWSVAGYENSRRKRPPTGLRAHPEPPGLAIHCGAMSNIFEKIVDGDVPCHRLYEDDHVLAFLDISPLSRGHCLVIPKERKTHLHELSDEAAAALGRVLPRLCRAVTRATGASAYNVLQNNGRDAGQVVDHVHFHIIPKTDGHGLGIVWIPGELSAEDAADLKEKVAAVLAG